MSSEAAVVQSSVQGRVRRDFLICCLLAQSGQAACYPPLPRLRCVGIQFEGVIRSLKAREEIGRQCNEFCCMVD
jgi:hypothetical protein